jgi:signal transduction histidine kinase/PAS domain-containing protein
VLSRLFLLIAFGTSLFLVLPVRLFAQAGGTATGPVIVTDANSEYQLGPYLEILDDPSGALTIDDVRSPAYSAQFEHTTADVPVYGLSSIAYWARAKVRNLSADPNWLLAFAPYMQDHVDFYLYDAGGRPVAATHTGNALPFSTRDLPAPNYLFRTPIPRGQDATLYLRIAGQYPVRFPVSILGLPAYVTRNDWVLLVSAGMYGFLLLMAVYNLILGASLRDRNYLLLALLIVAMVLALALRDGRAQQLLWPDHPDAGRIAIPVIVGLQEICLLLFAISFLETRVHAPKLHRALLVLMALLVAGLLLILPAAAGWPSFRAVLAILLTLGIPLVVLLLVAGPLVWRRGHRSARYFTLAQTVPLAFGIFDILFVLALVPISSTVAMIPRLGTVLLVLFFSLALADRVRALNLQAQQSNRARLASERLARQYLDAMPLGVAVYDTRLDLVYANSAASALVGRQDPAAMQTYPEANQRYPAYRTGTDDLYPLLDMPLYVSLRGVPASVDDLSMQVDGRRVPLEIWSTPLRDPAGRLQAVVAVFADITEKKRAEAELARYREDLEALVAERTRALSEANDALVVKERVADTLREAATLLNTGQGLGLLLTRILHLLGRVITYDRAAIFLEDDGDIVMVGAAGGAQRDLGQRIPIESDDPKAHVYREGSLLVLDQPQAELVSTSAVDSRSICSWVGLPLSIEDRTFGVLAIDSHESGWYSADDLDLLEAFAGQAAAAAWIARSYEQAQANAALAERERLARDLHDAVTQTLFSAGIIADMLPIQMAQDPAQAMASLDKLGQLMRSGLAEMRTLLMELRPAALVAASLHQLITNLVQAALVRSRVRFAYTAHGEAGPALPGDVQIAVYRIVQELLNNVMKHSGAPLCRIDLWYTADGVEITIVDNGRGFDPQEVSSDHMGLAIMRERARGIGATLDIAGQPEEGVYARLCWPGNASSEE